MEETTLRVRMLGGFSLSLGELCVSDGSSRSYKVWLLLAYLLYHRSRMIPQEELIRLLGGGERSADPNGALRVTLTRARRLLEPLSAQAGAELIRTRGGAYGWNPEAPVELDAEQFESLCRAAAAARLPEEKLSLYRQAVALYRGGFLSRMASDPWVEPIAVYFHNLYGDAVGEMLPLLNRAAAYGEAETLCRAALRDDPYNEALAGELIRSLMAQNDYDGADRVYQELREMLFADLGVVPGKQLQELHRAILSGRGKHYVSPESLREQLREHDPVNGPLICDMNSFRLFYRAEARSADRRGDAIHIGVLTVTGKDGKELSAGATARAMEQLREQLRSSLRIGDVAACCSETQYLIMLVQANFENSRMVCRRVIRGFSRAHTRSPAQIEFSVLPLEPLSDPERHDEEENPEE